MQTVHENLEPGRRANASFVILARNSDLAGTAKSIREIEDRFNSRYRYPYVLLNDEPFDDKFKECVARPLISYDNLRAQSKQTHFHANRCESRIRLDSTEALEAA